MGNNLVLILAVIAAAALGAAIVYVWMRRQHATPPAPLEPAQPQASDAAARELLVQAMPTPPATPPPPTQGYTPQFFELVTSDNRLTRIAINKAFTSIGRAPDNDIVVDEQFPGCETVAEHHARVELRGDMVIIEDLQSPSGVFVNDRRTGKNLLRNGWRLGLGDAEIIFRTIGLGTAPLNMPEPGLPGGTGSPPVPQRDRRDFAALPEGAILANRYAVIEIRNEMPHLNTYVIENLSPIRRCTQCSFEENTIDRSVCINCSASLDDALPYYPHYQAKETDEPGRIEVESRLVGLTHPAALLPREVVQESPYGSLSRSYLIGPDTPRHLAAVARVPQKVTSVLEWGAQLAEGLLYMHQHGVTMGAIDTWRVALDGRQAYWTDFSLCEYIPSDESDTRMPQDVVGLAFILHYLMTGQREYTPQSELVPPAVNNLMGHALQARRFQNAQQFTDALQATLVEVRRPSSVDLRVGRLSDVGQERQLNEDSLLTLELSRTRRSISEPLGLYAIADGMGGHAAGDVASALTIDTLARKAISEVWTEYVLESDALPDINVWLKLAVQEANQAVFGRRRASTSDMGTTLVVALVHAGMATIAHAGDSRAYLINQEGIRQVTTDHSLVQRLVQMGQLTPVEARTHPQRNVIYKNLGDKARVEPDINQVELAVNDRLLLCSDGLSGMLPDKDIYDIVMAAESPQTACCKLVEAANKAGGEDNISVVVVHIEAVG